jgi:hypothetical protein
MGEQALTPVLSLEDRYSQAIIEHFDGLCLSLPSARNPNRDEIKRILTATNQFIHICKGTERIDQKRLKVIYEKFNEFDLSNRGTREDPKLKFDDKKWYKDIFDPLCDVVRESQITAKQKYADPPGEDII